MTPKELVGTSMKSNRPVAHAIGMLERSIEDDPNLKELIRAVFMVYLMEKYPTCKVKLCQLPKRREPCHTWPA